MEKARLRAVVEGRVQGVGFRYFVAEQAEHLGLTGWVRNNWDRSVEVVAEGDRPLLESFLERLRAGPRMARVDHVRVAWEPHEGTFSDFRVTG